MEVERSCAYHPYFRVAKYGKFVGVGLDIISSINSLQLLAASILYHGGVLCKCIGTKHRYYYWDPIYSKLTIYSIKNSQIKENIIITYT